MTRAVVIADSGSVFAHVTCALDEVQGVEIVRHLSGRARVDAVVRASEPDLVLIDEMRWPPRALARLAEVRRAAPAAAIVVMADRMDGDWLAEALRTGAAAVMPVTADADVFRRVLEQLVTPIAAAA